MSAFIHIDRLGMSYGTPPRPILNKIDLEIEEGEFVCVLGQTGCGKSTLLRLLLGCERPTSGRILVDGREHHRPDATRGYVPQRYSLFPDKTVLDNITFGPEVREFNFFERCTPKFFRRRREFRDRAFDYLRRIGLQETDARKYPEQLSGGMQQRVAVAQALMTEPKILLMDEAFSALDPSTRREMQRLIHDLWKATGTTIVFVTHHTEEALRMGSRIIVLAKDHPTRGANVALDADVPANLHDDDVSEMVRALESASEGKPAWAVAARVQGAWNAAGRRLSTNEVSGEA